MTSTIAQGDPKSKNLDATEQWNAGLIIVGSHGQWSSARSALGSVSDAVFRHAPHSVEFERILPKHFQAESSKMKEVSHLKIAR